jgi:hypothetical protein
MKILKYPFIFLLFLALVNCGKYDEGPGFSLLPKSTRLQQKWRPIQFVDASTSVITEIEKDGSYLEFVKGGSLQYYNHDLMSFIGVAAATGTWEFSSDKTQVTVSYELMGLSSTNTYTINKLKINSLALIDEDGDKTYYEYF